MFAKIDTKITFHKIINILKYSRLKIVKLIKRILYLQFSLHIKYFNVMIFANTQN